ncbi:MAG: radical SAM family heme chaperone HemW [Bacteroidota bacterium]
MSGIYIHIPFCRQACHYCDFHFSTSLKNKAAFLTALGKEIILRKNYLASKEIHTLYFGGGTPSLLTQKELMGLFDELHRHFLIAPGAEITLEANPDDLTAGKIKELRQTPVNRLSIGIQSFIDRDLQWMNRAHSAEEALRSVKQAREAGFGNITIDLIYGIPAMTDEEWGKNLEQTFGLNVQHISAYCLTVEPRTALSHAVRRGKTKNVDDEKSAGQFEIMLAEMKKHDFIQYEISNFCKEGFHSRHNSSYWKGEHYLGLGPSAHSFDGASRQWNVADNKRYIAALEKGELDFTKEVLSTEQRYNDYILTSLRTMWGTGLEHIRSAFGTPFHEHILAEARKYLESGHLQEKENRLFLTDKGKLIADRIASDLFF